MIHFLQCTSIMDLHAVYHNKLDSTYLGKGFCESDACELHNAIATLYSENLLEHTREVGDDLPGPGAPGSSTRSSHSHRSYWDILATLGSQSPLSS